MKRLHFCLPGGDTRQKYLARLLRQDGHTVTTFALGDDSTTDDPAALGQGDCVLFSMPMAREQGLLYAPFSPIPIPICDILQQLSPAQFICGGKVNPETEQTARQRGLVIRDYLLREELAVANAVPTAEGAVQLAMEHLPITIHQCRTLVTGFGRVGQCTAQRFAALGAAVTVAARNPGQLALAETMGLAALPLSKLAHAENNWDLVLNTVPTPILGQAELERLTGSIILELASPPGGVDKTAAQALGIPILPASGLPGTVAPATAADIIRRTVYQMLEEAGF